MRAKVNDPKTTQLLQAKNSIGLSHHVILNLPDPSFHELFNGVSYFEIDPYFRS